MLIYKLFQALAYLVLISEVEEVEIFKICLEYWNALSADLYRENPYQPPTSPSMVFKVAPVAQLRRQFYAPVLSQVINHSNVYFNERI